MRNCRNRCTLPAACPITNLARLGRFRAVPRGCLVTPCATRGSWRPARRCLAAAQRRLPAPSPSLPPCPTPCAAVAACSESSPGSAGSYLMGCGAPPEHRAPPEAAPDEAAPDEAGAGGQFLTAWQLAPRVAGEEGANGMHDASTPGSTSNASAWTCARVALAEGGPPPLRVGAALGSAGAVNTWHAASRGKPGLRAGGLARVHAGTRRRWARMRVRSAAPVRACLRAGCARRFAGGALVVMGGRDGERVCNDVSLAEPRSATWRIHLPAGLFRLHASALCPVCSSCNAARQAQRASARPFAKRSSIRPHCRRSTCSGRCQPAGGRSRAPATRCVLAPPSQLWPHMLPAFKPATRAALLPI
jgi:hypothetical protein